jgi:two-component system LytT family response regulator
MDVLRIVIVDDEPLARAVLREYAAAELDLEIVADCANGFEAVKAVADLKPDLVLLDVQMPKLDGFEVLELLGRDQPVVFITAYDQYALRAFEVHAVDYLLKPFSVERFREAIARARDRVRAKAATPVDEVVRDAKPRTGHAERVLIRDGANVHVLPVDTIDYVEAQDDYVAFKSSGKQYLKDQTLGAVEATLDPSRFVRIHRSFVLNIDRIAKVELYAKDSRMAILRDGTRLPVSRAGYARLSQLLSGRLASRPYTTKPPLTLIDWPVTKRLSPVQSTSTIRATSSAVPSRPRGCRCCARSRVAGSPRWTAVMSVST